MTNTTELHQGTACRKLTLLNRNQDQLLTWAGTGCLSDGLKWFRTHVCSQNFLLASVSTTTRELEACLDYFFRICVLWDNDAEERKHHLLPRHRPVVHGLVPKGEEYTHRNSTSFRDIFQVKPQAMATFPERGYSPGPRVY